MNEHNARTLPLISVIIATYNRRDFIIEAVQSALNQTYQNIEVIIVDDGSTDDSRLLIEQAFGDDPRVTYYYQDNNKRASAFNRGLEHAKGEYIAIVDSDNRWLPCRLEKGYEALAKNPDYDIVYGDIILIDEHGEEISQKNMKRYSGKITSKLIKDNFVTINTALVPRRCFDEMGPMDVSRKRADDYELWLRMSTAYRFLYLPEFLAEYRVMDDQISSDKTRRLDANLSIISDFRKKFPESLSADEFDSGFAAFHCRKARHLASQGCRREALAEVLKALKLYPTGRGVWRSLAAVLFK